MERNHERGGIEKVVSMAYTLGCVFSFENEKNNPINYFVS